MMFMKFTKVEGDMQNSKWFVIIKTVIYCVIFKTVMFLSVVRRWRLAEEAPHICKQWSLCRRTKSSVWIEKVCFSDDCLTKINESVKMLPLGQSNPTFGNQILGTCSYTLGKLFTPELWQFSWFFRILKGLRHPGLQLSQSGSTPLPRHTFHSNPVQDFDFSEIYTFH